MLLMQKLLTNDWRVKLGV